MNKDVDVTESEQPDAAAGLDETLAETVESPTARPEPAWPSCPTCGAEVAPEDGYCEECGADLLVRRSEPAAPVGGP